MRMPYKQDFIAALLAAKEQGNLQIMESEALKVMHKETK